MSFNQFNPFQRFRETLKHEDHIHNQIEACRMARLRGDPTEVMYAIQGLNLLITPNMIDEQFLEESAELDEKWKMTKAEHEKDYQRELKRARGGCPDLVEKSSDKPGMEHWDSLYMICLSLFERRNLMLKIQTEDSI